MIKNKRIKISRIREVKRKKDLGLTEENWIKYSNLQKTQALKTLAV